jgi:hypothetical protein
VVAAVVPMAAQAEVVAQAAAEMRVMQTETEQPVQSILAVVAVLVQAVLRVVEQRGAVVALAS